MRSLAFTLLAALAGTVLPGQTASGWWTDPRHPQLQYRVKCTREMATLEWRNGYPGEVHFKASVHSFDWDSTENVIVAPNASGQTELETIDCAPGIFRISLDGFSMKSPPSPPSPPAEKPPPVLPTVQAYEPPTEKVPQITLEALASVHVGMKEQEVFRKLGSPWSRVTLDEDGRLIETCRYRMVRDRFSVIRFSDGVVAEITAPRS